MRRNTILFVFIMALVVVSCGKKEKPSKKISLENTLDIIRQDEPVILERKTVDAFFQDIPNGHVPVVMNENNEQIPSQTDDLNFDGEWDELIFTLTFQPNETKTVSVILLPKSERKEYPRRTNIRFGDKKPPFEELDNVERLKSTESAVISKVFQMEGPAWENDKVAFRNYFDARNGIDIFGKRTESMVLDSVGIRGQNYHELDSWGMDILKVGNSLGAGAIALEVKDSVYRIGLSEKAAYKLVAEGPVRSVFQLSFMEQPAGGNVYDVIHTISIVAGAHYYKSTVKANGLSGNESLVTGIVNMESDSLIMKEFADAYVSLATHDNQAYTGEILGMGLLIEKEMFEQTMTAPEKGEGIVQTYMADLKISENKPAVFYFFSGWEYENPKFKNPGYFLSVIEKDAKKLNSPVMINY
jgi:hypothetical protein